MFDSRRIGSVHQAASCLCILRQALGEVGDVEDRKKSDLSSVCDDHRGPPPSATRPLPSAQQLLHLRLYVELEGPLVLTKYVTFIPQLEALSFQIDYSDRRCRRLTATTTI